MTREQCHGFNVLPYTEFYAIPYWKWKQFFSRKYTNKVLELTKNAIGVHFWNGLNSDVTIRIGSKCAYALLAKEFCPKVFGSCEKYFN